MTEGLLDRRTVLALLAAGAATGLQGAQSFTPGERDFVETLAELIIPADAHSPGARAAGVGKYIELVVSNSSQDFQASWKAGMAAFDEFLRAQCGQPLVRANAPSRTRALDRLVTQNETGAARFFHEFRELTITGYYTSEIGLLKELNYQGNQVMPGFPGCKDAM